MAEGPELRGLEELRVVAARLKDAGDEGKGLKRELMRALAKVANPVAEKIGAEEHLKVYLPDRYAAVLAPQLSVKAQRVLSGSNPRVSISAKTRRERRRRVNMLDDGWINHPVYAQAWLPRKKWTWANRQTGGMKPGFFSDVIDEAMPDLREKVLAAITETNDKIMR